MSETLYMKLEQNPEISTDSIHISDISETWCRDKHVLAKCRAVKVGNLNREKKNRLIYSAMELVQMIQEAVEGVEVTVLGEQDVIISYQPKKKVNLIWEWCKTVVIALIIFFGSAFAIMTFNNDVGVQQVFDELHEWVMGESPEGMSALEISYTIGLAAGILIFYNHFRRKSRISDPTPLEVEMRQYETDVNTAIIQEDSRIKNNKELSGAK